MYILLSEYQLEGEECKTEDNPWMFQRVSCTCEQQFCKINYKYERCKHIKTKFCYKNFPCSFICSSIFSFFLLCGDFKFDLVFFIQLIWWIRAHWILKNSIKKRCFKCCCIPYQILLIQPYDSTNLIKLIWLCISGHLSVVDWFK